VGVFRSKLLRVDTPDNLRVGLFGKGTQVRVVGDAAQWIETVHTLSFVHNATAQQDTLFISLDEPDEQNPLVVQTLVHAGAQIRAVAPTAHSLEDVYLELLDSDKESQHAYAEVRRAR
jgi:ABC-2 type transport system ATP-binding protein